MTGSQRDRPLSIAMLALGGQGGGVLTTWLVELAEANAYLAQSTYIAGVAQRTGATVYCVEMFPTATAEAAGAVPVFTPYPIPGDVDLVVAGELAETGRAIEKGFVTPNLTTLIASSHRVYSMSEKEALGDGIIDLAPLRALAAKIARRFICFDMQQCADDSASIISSVLFGAIAGSGALPFPREAFEATIRNGGKAVESNLRGFAAGFAGASDAGPVAKAGDAIEAAVPEGPNGHALAERIDATLPASVQNFALHGALKALDFQDMAYARAYLDRLDAIVARDNALEGYALSTEVARQLALQMCYEDTIRVADLKIRPDRFERIRQHVAAQQDQPVAVVEYFHPRLEEVCDTLPASLGRFVLNSAGTRKLLGTFFRQGRNVRTTGITGFMLMYLLARMKRFRRGTYRFGVQQDFIDDWLARVGAQAEKDYDYAVAVARLIEMVKGYGETYERGLARYRATLAAAETQTGGTDALFISKLHQAALSDEKGQLFQETLAAVGAGG